MEKLHIAGAKTGTRELAALLDHWRRGGVKLAAARRLLLLASALFLAGIALLAYVLWPMGALAGKQVLLPLGPTRIDALWIGPAAIALGAIVGLIALLGRTWTVELPHDRPLLSADELRLLRTSAVKHSIRGALRAG
jgi:hypothetical protein